MLFDANVLLDVFLQRENAYPAARALTFAETDAVKGYICASVFGVICHHGATSGPGRQDRERRLAKELLRFLQVLPLTEEVLTAALGYEHLSFEDAQIAAAGDMKCVDAILTNDRNFLQRHDFACAPRDLVAALGEHLGDQYICRVVKTSPEGAYRVEISDPAGGWRQTLPLAGFLSQEDAERVAGVWQAVE